MIFKPSLNVIWIVSEFFLFVSSKKTTTNNTQDQLLYYIYFVKEWFTTIGPTNRLQVLWFYLALKNILQDIQQDWKQINEKIFV